VDKKLVGPSYQDVAAKYAGKPGAVDTLSMAILHGVSGGWGPIPMPANPQVTPAQAKELAGWVLMQKKT
jgi:cytochrome c